MFKIERILFCFVYESDCTKTLHTGTVHTYMCVCVCARTRMCVYRRARQPGRAQYLRKNKIEVVGRWTARKKK